ncbi:MAG: TadE/TadG family protein [Alphaproteobacteria bacterium]|nr:TadE/TadG family protein [Alphaproteobacteria bacterium]
MANLLKNFCSDTRGNIMFMFGFLVIPFMLAAGVAIDYGRAVIAKHKLQASMDTAVLAAGSLRTATEDERKALGKAFFEANFPASEYNLNVGDDFISINGNVISADETTSIPTKFMQLSGLLEHGGSASPQEMEIRSDATALVPQIGNAEIALVLDYSGSMKNYLNGEKKYKTMRDAAIDLVNNVSQNGTHDGVSFTLIPFHSGVRANLKSEHLLNADGILLTGTSRTWSCVGDRRENNTNDTEPSTSSSDWRHRWQQNRMWRWSTWGGGSNKTTSCSSSLPIIELTNDISSLASYLQSWSPPSGNKQYTAISAGFSFGWHSISDNTVFEGGSSYDLITAEDPEDRVIKAIVLLTDGAQTASAHRHISNGGQGDNPLGDDDWPLKNTNAEENLEEQCTAAKAKGVLVITVAFDLDDEDTVTRLQNCASPKPEGTGNYTYVAGSTGELTAAFEDIGNVLSEMVYLSQ